MHGTILAFIVVALLFPSIIHAAGTGDESLQCEPTPADHPGPFYRPDAPVRDKVGQGYVLIGTVRSAADCAPVNGAKIEFWLAGPSGAYDDDHRATLFVGDGGTYRFESNFPPPYGRRPSHIHIRVSAPGFRTLITQHYPRSGENGASFDLVLVPAP